MTRKFVPAAALAAGILMVGSVANAATVPYVEKANGFDIPFVDGPAVFSGSTLTLEFIIGGITSTFTANITSAGVVTGGSLDAKGPGYYTGTSNLITSASLQSVGFKGYDDTDVLAGNLVLAFDVVGLVDGSPVSTPALVKISGLLDENTGELPDFSSDFDISRGVNVDLVQAVSTAVVPLPTASTLGLATFVGAALRRRR